MNMQYLGFLPLCIAIVVIHVWVYRDYKSAIKDGSFVWYHMDPLPLALAFVIWLFLIIGGAMWALLSV